eukprot:3423078-Prymnesium_polylepis.1
MALCDRRRHLGARAAQRRLHLHAVVPLGRKLVQRALVLLAQRAQRLPRVLLPPHGPGALGGSLTLPVLCPLRLLPRLDHGVLQPRLAREPLLLAHLRLELERSHLTTRRMKPLARGARREGKLARCDLPLGRGERRFDRLEP